MTDTELRERFAQWADPLRATPPPPVATIRRRARRHAAGLAVASGLVLAAVGLTAGLVASGLGATVRPPDAGLWGRARYPAPPGQQYVFVNDPGGDRAQLRDATTGAVVEVLRPSVSGASFIAATAAAGDRLFVLAEEAATPAGGPASGQITFAELRISGSRGKVTVRLTPVLSQVHLMAGDLLISMTVNATGTRLALTDQHLSSASSSLNVYNLSTGALLDSWHSPPSSVSRQQFIGRGDELAVFWPLSEMGSHGLLSGPAGDGPSVPLGLQLVDTAAAFPPGSSLPADSRAETTLSGGADGAFSQNGLVILPTPDGSLRITTAPGPTADLLASDAAGKPLWSVPLGPASALRGRDFCGVLWASADGRDLLTQCGTRQLSISNGKAAVIHLAWMFPTPGTAKLCVDGNPCTSFAGFTAFAW